MENETVSSEPVLSEMPAPKKPGKKVIIISVFVAVLVGALLTLGVLFAVGVLEWNIFGGDNSNNNNFIETEITNDETNQETDLPEAIPGEFRVSWYDQAKVIDKDTILSQIDPNYKETLPGKLIYGNCAKEGPEWVLEDYLCDVYIYEAGIIYSPESLAGKILYDVFIPYSEMGSGFSLVYAAYDDETKKFIEIYNEDDHSRPFPEELSGWVGEKVNQLKFIQLEPQTILDVPEHSEKLVLSGWYDEDKISVSFSTKYAPNTRGGIIDVPEGRFVPKFSASKIAFYVNDGATPVYYDDTSYYIYMPDGSLSAYELIPEFLYDAVGLNAIKERYFIQGVPEITWVDGIKNEDQYALAGEIPEEISGCGPGMYTRTNIVNNQTWFNSSKLVKIGQLQNSNPIYELSDKNTNEYYKRMFNFVTHGKYYDLSEEEKVVALAEEFEDFINNHPVFFWQDSFDNWRVYYNAEYQPAVECGKPVIYLYPEEETDVNVQVQPNGGLTVTEPEYSSDGWSVRANPNGELYSYNDGNTYPYLFWEGHASGFDYPKQGFVFTQSEVDTGMRNVLSQAGLNESEINDFLEFWLPKMTIKPYVFITFASQRDFEVAAPLNITPKPDTVIRVFMNFTLLDELIEVKPLPIFALERKGFTVIEWGGVLQNTTYMK